MRHGNYFKWSLADQAEWYRFVVHTEPIHKFLSFIRRRDSFHTKRARQRQGLMPDLLDVRGQRLMDIKCMTCGTNYGPARFRHAQRCDAVKVRGEKVHADVTAKARKIDVDYNDWAPSSVTPDPVQQRLQGFGRVFGLVIYMISR